MKIRTKLVFTALLLLTSLSANAQLIGEGDTLWYKSLYPNTISHVQFSPDGSKLGVVVNQNEIRMFNVQNGDSLWARIFNTRIYRFTVSQSGTSIWVNNALDSELVEMDWNNGDIMNRYRYKNPVSYYNMVFSTPNPKVFLMTNHAQSFALYDIEKGEIIKEKKISHISKYGVSPYSDYFILAYQYESSNTWKTKINIYDIKTLDNIATLGEEEGLVENGGEAKISYNGKYAATNFGGRALQIWDLENKKLFKEYTPTIPTDSTTGRGGGPSLAFCNNEELLINCGGRFSRITTMATTITNLVIDKRAIIYPDNGFSTIDINNLDTKLAGGSGGDIVVLKLRKDAVPVKEYSQNSEPEIYPNPATDYINIQLSNKRLQPFAVDDKIQIFDILGVEVLAESIPTMTSSHRMNIEKLAAGVYFIKIGAKVEKFLKM
ncbi:hypothetical protein MASR1M45_00480 [Candidatus Kapaibacterium sp.]